MKDILCLFILASGICHAPAQVGFNNPNPDGSALLDLKGNDKGLLRPSMTFAQRGRGGDGNKAGEPATGNTATTTTGISINNSGGNQAHENRPPYYALAYIMKL